MFNLPFTSETLPEIYFNLPSGHSRKIISNGEQGTAETIALMQKMVGSYKRNDDIRKLCGNILNPKNGQRPCQSKDYLCYASKFYEWVRDNILYAYDPNSVEYIESPKAVLKNRIGDCDSMDMLLASMFEQIGLESQFVTIKADASRPNEFTHVYTRVKIPKVGWVCADPIMPDKHFGWEPPYPHGKKYWAGSSDATGPVDTTDSVGGDVSSDVSSFAGLGAIGHGGHHGGRGRRGGGYWGGGPYWGGSFDDNIYVLPVAVPVTDQYAIAAEGALPQAMENPAGDRSEGMRGLASMGAVSNETASNWISRILSGEVARDLKDRRERANKNGDMAYRVLAAAKKTKSAKAISAATNFQNAVRQEQYAINAAVAKYNELREFIGGLTRDAANIPPTLNGMDGVPQVIALVLASAVGAALLYKFISLMADVANTYGDTERGKNGVQQAIVSDPNLSPAEKTEMLNAIGGGIWGGVKDAFREAGTSAMKVSLVIGGIFIAYKAIDALKNRRGGVSV